MAKLACVSELRVISALVACVVALEAQGTSSGESRSVVAMVRPGGEPKGDTKLLAELVVEELRRTGRVDVVPLAAEGTAQSEEIASSQFGARYMLHSRVIPGKRFGQLISPTFSVSYRLAMIGGRDVLPETVIVQAGEREAAARVMAKDIAEKVATALGATQRSQSGPADAGATGTIPAGSAKQLGPAPAKAKEGCTGGGGLRGMPSTVDMAIQTAHSGMVVDFVFSSKGDLLFTLGIDGVIKVWNATCGIELKTLAGFRIVGIALSQADDVLAGVEANGNVHLIEVGSWAEHKLEGQPWGAQVVESGLDLNWKPIQAVFADAGKTLVHASPNGLTVWDLASRRASQVAADSRGENFALSPDGMTVAVSKKPFALLGGNEHDSITVLNRTTRATNTFSASVGKVTSLRFSFDGRQLLVGSRFGSVKALDAQTGKEVFTYQDDPCDSARGLLDTLRVPFGGIPDILTKAGNACDLGAIIKGARQHGLAGAFTRTIRSLDTSPDGQFVAAGLADGTVKVWEGKMVRSIAGPYRDGGEGFIRMFLAASPVRFRLVAEPGIERKALLSTIREFKNVHTWTAGDGSPAQTLAVARRDLMPTPIPIPLGSVPVFARLDGRKALITSTLTSGTKVWDFETGNRAPELVSDQPLLSNYSPISPDGRLVARIEGDLSKKAGVRVVLSAFRAGTILHQFPQRYDGYTTASFSPDGAYLTLAGKENDKFQARIYEVRPGQSEPVERAKLPSVESVTYSGAGRLQPTRRVAVLSRSKDSARVEVRDLDPPRIIADFKLRDPGGSLLSTIALSEDGSLLAALDAGVVKVWRVGQKNPVAHYRPGGTFDISNLVFVPGKEILTFTTARSLHHWDIGAKEPRTSKVVTDFWGNLSYEPEGVILAIGGAENRVRLFDTRLDKEIGSLIAPNLRDWIVASPSGHLDTARLEDVEEVHWISGEEPAVPYPFETFSKEAFEPNLLAAILDDARRPKLGELKLQLKSRAVPEVVLSSIERIPGKAAVRVEVTVRSTIDSKGDGGVRDLRLFRDGRLVGRALEATDVLTSGERKVSFEVALPQAERNSRVELSAYAFNRDRVRGAIAKTQLSPPVEDRELRVPVVYFVGIGVERVAAKNFGNVAFAENDIVKLISQITSSLAGLKVRPRVVAVPLLSGNATRQNIKAVLDVLAGRADAVPSSLANAVPAARDLRRSTPDDLLFITVSSHGEATPEGVYRFITGDLEATTNPTEQARVTSGDLSDWLNGIDSHDLALAFDTCQAGASVRNSGFKPGPFGYKGLGQLAYDLGAQVLAASDELSAAYASANRQMGYLSFALFEGLSSGAADAHPSDGQITLREWFEFAVQRALKELKDPKRGSAVQSPSAGVGSVPISAQAPVLFDFVWDRNTFVIGNKK